MISFADFAFASVHWKPSLRAHLPLREVEKRDRGRHLPSLGIARDDLLRGLRVRVGPLEAFPACALFGVVEDACLAGH